MVEVFKTNVVDPKQADLLIVEICNLFPQLKVNFDLEDCDKILRVETEKVLVDVYEIIHVLERCGFQSEVLSDVIISDFGQ